MDVKLEVIDDDKKISVWDKRLLKSWTYLSSKFTSTA